jgi:LPS export ABC transporter protein LptC
MVALASPLWWPVVADFLRPRGGFADNQTPPVVQYQQFAMEGVLFTRSTGGRQDVQITATRLTTTERENELYLEEVDALLYGDSGSPFHVTSGVGLYDTDHLTLTLEKQVRVQLANDYELHTDLLLYNEKAGRVVSETPVRLEGPDLEVHGQGMTYDLATGSYTVAGRLRVLLR